MDHFNRTFLQRMYVMDKIRNYNGMRYNIDHLWWNDGHLYTTNGKIIVKLKFLPGGGGSFLTPRTKLLKKHFTDDVVVEHDDNIIAVKMGDHTVTYDIKTEGLKFPPVEDVLRQDLNYPSRVELTQRQVKKISQRISKIEVYDDDEAGKEPVKLFISHGLVVSDIHNGQAYSVNTEVKGMPRATAIVDRRLLRHVLDLDVGELKFSGKDITPVVFKSDDGNMTGCLAKLRRS